MILEAGMDAAYVYAGENYIKNNLGRPKEHYYRKIYDGCLEKN
jgi:hypothetical protein